MNQLAGIATGIGSMPGVSVRESLSIITTEISDLVHIPELPARGLGAEMIGRTMGILQRVDDALAVETTPSGWRIASGENRIMRRAISWLGEDLDVFEEIASGHTGNLKFQIAGPWTLAASIEALSGIRLVNDLGAVHDLTQAISAAIGNLSNELHRRFPQASWVIQVDEPWLGGVMHSQK